VDTPLTEENRLVIFVSRDPTIFSIDLLSGGDSVYTRQIFHENFSTPVKTCLICTGTPVKTCWKFWQLLLFFVRFPPSVDTPVIVTSWSLYLEATTTVFIMCI